jgi:hypothetical protein
MIALALAASIAAPLSLSPIERFDLSCVGAAYGRIERERDASVPIERSVGPLMVGAFYRGQLAGRRPAAPWKSLAAHAIAARGQDPKMQDALFARCVAQWRATTQGD